MKKVKKKRIVMGIDSAMNNCGVWVGEMERRLESSFVEGDFLHDRLREVFTVNITPSDKKLPQLTRIIEVTRKVKSLIHEYRPEVITIEASINFGRSKSTTGLATLACIVDILMDQPVDGPLSGTKVVLITPERLNGLAHGKGKPTKTEVKKAFREAQPDSKASEKEDHEWDAYFLCFYGVRFVLTFLENSLSLNYLSDKEINYHSKNLDGKGNPNSTFHCPGKFWWTV